MDGNQNYKHNRVLLVNYSAPNGMFNNLTSSSPRLFSCLG